MLEGMRRYANRASVGVKAEGDQRVGDAYAVPADMAKKTVKVAIKKQTYLNILYLLVLFPLGIGGFTAAGTALAVTFMFLTAPIVVPFSHYDMGIWNMDTVGEGFILMALGIPLGLLSLHALNLLAGVCECVTREVLTFTVQSHA